MRNKDSKPYFAGTANNLKTAPKKKKEQKKEIHEYHECNVRNDGSLFLNELVREFPYSTPGFSSKLKSSF